MLNKLLLLHLIIVILVFNSCVFFQSDKSYLKNKSIKLLKLVAFQPTSPSGIALMTKVNEINLHIAPVVKYNMNLMRYGTYTGSNLSDLKTLMLFYFKSSTNIWKINTPFKKEISVQIITDKKKAEVSFPITAIKNNEKINCKTTLQWQKNEKWLIHNINVFSCTLE